MLLNNKWNVFIHILFTLVLFFFISKIAVENFNAALYLAFSIITGYLLFLLFKQHYDYNSGKKLTCIGTILSIEKVPDRGDFKIDVEFYSPLNNQQYHIEARVKKIPPDRKVEIIFNSVRPHKSKVYEKPPAFQLVILGATLVVSLYKCADQFL